MAARKEASGGTQSRRNDPDRLTPQLLPAAPDPEATQEVARAMATPSQHPSRRASLAWQLWLDGDVRRTPLPLADGLFVLLDRPSGSVALRLDGEGREVWQLELPGVASADPVRTQGFVAVALDGASVVVIDVAHGRLMRARIAVDGASVGDGVAALGGRLWVRLGKSADGLGPFLAVLDVMAPDDGVRLFPDPLGAAIETRFRRTNRTIVAAAEHNGTGHLVGIDEASARVLWQHELPNTGIVDLWAAGGLVDVVLSIGVRSWDARSGMSLTRRFDGHELEGGRLAGETLLMLVPDRELGGRLLAYEAATEEPSGQMFSVQRIVGASSDLTLVTDAVGGAVLAELPDLNPLAFPESDAIEGPVLAAFSRHAVWVVAHGGRSLSRIEPPAWMTLPD